ncbi:hypothetical protein CERSUDRAFT_123637 [Gelatoporia subvermispora B]|uniref:Uncharacterized protein n=1 Tax=Ceriporiopsis subvermispora (strain B) TaxID=914234 RepID=M2RG29_CERS8|nr:hypothetical protein CERSUDRAFT_123637 [Gelatoporia subvermispora B]
MLSVPDTGRVEQENVLLYSLDLTAVVLYICRLAPQACYDNDHRAHVHKLVENAGALCNRFATAIARETNHFPASFGIKLYMINWRREGHQIMNVLHEMHALALEQNDQELELKLNELIRTLTDHLDPRDRDRTRDQIKQALYAGLKRS